LERIAGECFLWGIIVLLLSAVLWCAFPIGPTAGPEWWRKAAGDFVMFIGCAGGLMILVNLFCCSIAERVKKRATDHFTQTVPGEVKAAQWEAEEAERQRLKQEQQAQGQHERDRLKRDQDVSKNLVITFYREN